MREQSKKIGSFIAMLKIAYPRFFNELEDNDFIALTNLYEDMLGGYNEETLNQTAKTIIRTMKYMPSIKEILEVCEQAKVYKRNQIIETMIQDGYFKSPTEIDKVYMWIEEGIIPSWLKEDMKKYYNKGIKNKEIKLIES